MYRDAVRPSKRKPAETWLVLLAPTPDDDDRPVQDRISLLFEAAIQEYGLEPVLVSGPAAAEGVNK